MPGTQAGVALRLTWDYLPAHLHVTFPSGLGSSRHSSWFLRRSVPRRSVRGVSVPREQERLWGISHLTWEVRNHHLRHTHWLQGSPWAGQSQEGRKHTPLVDGGESRSHCGRACGLGVNGVVMFRKYSRPQHLTMLPLISTAHTLHT